MHTFDLHVHTIHSGDSPCKVKDVIRIAKEKGLDGIAITDHDSVAGVEKAFEITKDEHFLVIPGIEVSSKDGHILGLGVEDLIPPDQSAAKTVEEIREKEGIAVAAHPFSLGLNPLIALKSDFDAVEIFNPRRYLGNRLTKKYVLNKSVSVTAGSDAHFCEEVGLAGVEVNADLQIREVLKKIKQGKASVFGRALPLSDYLRRALFKVSAYR